jgi:hypothetical protein
MSASKVEVGRSLPGAGKDRQRNHENLPHVAKFMIKKRLFLLLKPRCIKENDIPMYL